MRSIAEERLNAAEVLGEGTRRVESPRFCGSGGGGAKPWWSAADWIV